MNRTIPSTRGTVVWLCAWCLSATAAQAPKTLDQLRNEAAVKSQSPQSQPERTDTGELQSLRPGLTASRAVSCPTANAVDSFKYEIAYERTEELNPTGGLASVPTHIWERDPLTAFYVDEPLRTFSPNIRLVYLVGTDGARGSFSCPVDQDWQKCIRETAGLEGANNLERTCTTTIDLRNIPGWKPSPNDQRKRQIADELRREIEAQWPAAQEIVIRDFNLKDRQITIYLKMPDGDYFEGCGFRAASEPHCAGWHRFGMVPNSSIRKRIFELPYRLK